ncbi:MAG: GFA family protein [Proteobacteria bacterium]|nr:GFA family protein [Pseudomonadota bacterium]
MNRHAHCQCGRLQVDSQGEPDSVVVCSCTECQRRSGSPFGEGAYYQRDKLSMRGTAREYVRKTEAGNSFHTFFCPICATSLYFFSSRDPNRVGVAVGAFADPSFPAPHRSVFDESKHSWIALPADTPGFTRGRDSDRTR